MIKITVQNAAHTFRVHSKTIREWIDQGMPVVKRGGKGQGNGAIIDLVRATDWVRRWKRSPPPEWADYFADSPNRPPNPLRWLLELYAGDTPHIVAAALLAWLREPRNKAKQTDWQMLGLTEAQAHRVVWDTFSWILNFLATYKTNQFEQTRLAPVAGGADLDDLASMWFSGDIRSHWDDDVEIPAEIMAFAPPEFHEACAKNQKAPA